MDRADDVFKSPLARQWRVLKGGLPEGCILFIRLGDFYESFFGDAGHVAGTLGVALTVRNGMPMAGVPYHAIDAGVGRMAAAGYTVAVAEDRESGGIAVTGPDGGCDVRRE